MVVVVVSGIHSLSLSCSHLVVVLGRIVVLLVVVVVVVVSSLYSCCMSMVLYARVYIVNI